MITLIVVTLLQIKIPTPTLPQLLREDLVAKAQIRWSRVVDGKRVAVTIQGGEAERMNPNWSPEPVPLKYDLDRNRALEKAVKAARLGPPRRHPSESPKDRTLELYGQGQGGWVVIATWSMPEKTWAKKHAALYEHLEPLLEVQAEVFGKMKGPER